MGGILLIAELVQSTPKAEPSLGKGPRVGILEKSTKKEGLTQARLSAHDLLYDMIVVCTYVHESPSEQRTNNGTALYF